MFFKYNMHSMQLSNIDLNLLPLLHALLETASVQSAARRVALSASAASHGLSRLRDALSDPILVRAGSAMVLSERARELRPAVARAVEQVGAVFGEFTSEDPTTARRKVTFACNDVAELDVLCRLSAQVSTKAPGIDLHSRRAGPGTVEELRNGSVDLGLAVFGGLPSDIRGQHLFEDQFVCLFRRGHPALEGRLTAKRYADLEHVLVTHRGESARGIVDSVLEERGYTRRVARTVSSFLVAPHVVQGTDYVLTISARVAARMAKTCDLVIRRPPIDLPSFHFSLVWHRSAEENSVLQWLRDRVVEVAK